MMAKVVSNTLYGPQTSESQRGKKRKRHIRYTKTAAKDDKGVSGGVIFLPDCEMPSSQAC